MKGKLGCKSKISGVVIKKGGKPPLYIKQKNCLPVVSESYYFL